MASASSNPPFKVKALYDYTSGHDDDLSFNADEVITVTAIEDADWYYGEYKDKATGEQKEGIFPTNFVERIVVEVPARPVRSGGARKKSIPDSQQAEQQHHHHAELPTPAEEPEKTEAQAAPAAARPPTPPPAAPPVEQPKAVQPPAAVTTKPAEASEPPPAQQPKLAPTHSPVEPPKATPASPPSAPATSKSAAATSSSEKSKPPPPDKPSSSSFKDRLALFNKGSAAPIAPFDPHKPRADFPKKKFVPPPPSKNSYVPPPISHVSKPKRDEETLLPPAEPPVKSSVELERDPEENKPKQSLKERIALLQTQQLNAQAISGEKPKRPPKPKRAPSEKAAGEEAEITSPISPEDEQPRQSHEFTRPQTPKGIEEHEHETPVPAKAKRSVEIRREDIHEESSAGEADVSSAASVERREEPQARIRRPALAHQSDFGDDEGGNDTPDPPDSEEDQEEEEEVDPEVARKIALRDRMMKLSTAGGMGMHGVFGAPMGMPMGAPPPKKKTPVKAEHDRPRKSHDAHEEELEQRSPVVAVPVQLPFALPKAQAPPAEESESEEEDVTPAPRKISPDTSRRGSVDEERKPAHADKPHGPRPMPNESRSPPADRPAPPPVPASERPAPPPPPPTESRPPPPPPAAVQESQSEGSKSDDELSQAPSKAPPTPLPPPEAPRAVPPPPPPPGSYGRPGSSGPSGPSAPTSPQSNKRISQSYFAQQNMSPGGESTPSTPGGRRASYQRGVGMPPIPTGMTSPGAVRPPPPPPSGAPPIPRRSMENSRPPTRHSSDTDEEVTEYEADYDTDMANKVGHRDALTAKHGKNRLDEEDETPLPSPTITPQVPTRAVPPPPSSPPPPPVRQSLDMPRAAPPPPPPPPPPPVENQAEDEDDEYDPFKYNPGSRYDAPGSPPPAPSAHQQQRPSTERLPSRGNPRASSDVRPPTSARASMDIPRGLAGRRSMDQNRPHFDFVAQEIDPGLGSQWWLKPNTLPPVLQGRAKDLSFEIEQSSTGSTITKDVYVLFHDYSQTVLTVSYDQKDPVNATITQRHEAPPPQPRQDQLEDLHIQYGTKILNGAKAKENTVVGDGEPATLIRELLKLAPHALIPVGSRAYGCLVYANLANASVQHLDEIRPGDIISFRNARFQGHRGGLHQKYTTEVGKPDHVGIVVDWDGTKKKIRAYEQGRESKKCKIESYKVGDLRSGEVKVWRVAARSWVGWEGEQS